MDKFFCRVYSHGPKLPTLTGKLTWYLPVCRVFSTLCFQCPIYLKKFCIVGLSGPSGLNICKLEKEKVKYFISNRYLLRLSVNTSLQAQDVRKLNSLMRHNELSRRVYAPCTFLCSMNASQFRLILRAADSP